MSDGDDYSDFEVVPQDKDDDVDMWDVEGENEDVIKQAKIQSKHPSPIYILPSLAHFTRLRRTRSHHSRSRLARTSPRQPGEDPHRAHQ